MSDRTHPRRRRRLSAGDVRELARIEMTRIAEGSDWTFSPAGGTPPARQAASIDAGQADIDPAFSLTKQPLGGNVVPVRPGTRLPHGEPTSAHDGRNRTK